MTTPLSPITPAQQTTFALGAFAGLSFSVTGKDPDQATYQLITAALDKAAPTIGQWNIVWGPSIVQQPIGTAYAMNTMYVAQSAVSPSQYTIAIAGTNPRSILDWIIEDGLVSWQLPWIYAPLDARGARIALGTAIGLSILQNMKPSSTVPGSCLTLRDFLATITSQPIELAVVGHSLGGALAPTLALWLADTQGFLSHWDPHRNATLSVLPTAGPTAGNREFATYSGKKLGERLTPYYNTLDVVPHAWHKAMLEQIPDLYIPNIPNLRVVDTLVKLAIDISQNGDYTTLPGLTALPGTYEAVSGWLELEKFLREVAYQHTVAYDSWFNFHEDWLPTKRHAPAPPSPALIDALSSGSATAGDIAQTLAAEAPRKLVIGNAVIDAPIHPADPRGAEAIVLVATELAKHAAQSHSG